LGAVFVIAEGFTLASSISSSPFGALAPPLTGEDFVFPFPQLLR